MKKVAVLLLLISLSWILPWEICPGIGTDPDVPQGSSSQFGNSIEPPNPSEFWALFNSVISWDLEYSEGAGWNSIKGDLSVLRNYTTPWICKIRLLFDSSYHADYRLTLLVDQRVLNYTYVENRTRYFLSYQGWEVFFSWEDLLEIPGLQFSHGIIDYGGKPCFWFRVRRDDVPQGIRLDLDPTFGNTDHETVASGTLADAVKGDDYQLIASSGDTFQAQSISFYADLISGGPHNVKAALYYSSNRSFLAGTEEIQLSSGDGEGWKTLNFEAPKPSLSNNTGYIIVAWSDGSVYIAESEIGAYSSWNEAHSYDGWPSSLNAPDFSREFSIYCTYLEMDTPTIGSFQSSQDPALADQWFSLNATINDSDGIAELKNCTLALNGSIVLAWDNATETFSIDQDPSGYCTLNSTACIEDEINSTAFTLSWRIQLSSSYPEGSISILDTSTVWDTTDLSSTGSHSDLFSFYNAPTVGEYSASASTIWANEWFSLNCTLNDETGYTNLKNSTLALNGSLSLAWDNITDSFSIASDPNSYCTLNTSACFVSQKNSTALNISWSLLLSWSYPQGSISILSSTVYDLEGNSGSGSQEDGLFSFEPDIEVLSATPSANTVEKGVGLEVSGTFRYEGRADGPQNVTGLWARLELSGSLVNSAIPGTDGTYLISFVSPGTEGDYYYTVYTEANPVSILNQTFMITVSSQTMQGGGFIHRRTPLEKIGVPTPFPYEVAPPEAQYGTISLIIIMVGAVLYYLRGPKTVEQLWKENTSSTVSYGPRKQSKRKIHQKKQRKRKVHTKK